jgi:hypothetical protein
MELKFTGGLLHVSLDAQTESNACASVATLFHGSSQYDSASPVQSDESRNHEQDFRTTPRYQPEKRLGFVFFGSTISKPLLGFRPSDTEDNCL